MGELEDQYNRDKKSYSDGKYSAFIQREQNDLCVKMNRQQSDIFLQYQKGELSREEATGKILHCALKSRRQLFKHDYDEDDVQGAEEEKESEDEEFFDTSDVWSPEDRARDLIRKNIQTDNVLDLIANTTLTVAQQAQTPTIPQQADMYNLRTTVKRKPAQKFTPSTYNQQKTKKKNKSGSEKRRRRKIKQAESEKENKI